jgi:SpoVK/Ycf46/Vps4 family AAA+-type ATPase
MSVDPSVLQALRVALEAAPDDRGLRLHLAQLLGQAAEHAEAAEHFAVLLEVAPDDLDALRGAAASAEALDATEKAAGYRRLLTALGGEAGVPVQGLSLAPPTTEASDEADEDPEAEEAGEGRAFQVVEGAKRFMTEEETEAAAAFLETPDLTLDDVKGLEAVKRRLNVAFLGPLRNPEIRKAYGKSLRGGLLLYGPPGCGKTHVARATAGELKASFLSVGVTDVLDMWMGESERKLSELFKLARRHAPAVLFFDEIDALGHKRSALRGHAGRNLVNVLLSEMDGVDSENEELFVMAATNQPWDVDPALRRPGRFDRVVLVLPPDLPAREAILESRGARQPCEGVDWSWLAKKTEGYSGADLVHLCDSAVEQALEESLTSGQVRPLRQGDFKRALKEVRASVRPWFDHARNFAMFQNEGGEYDELLAHIKTNKY